MRMRSSSSSEWPSARFGITPAKLGLVYPEATTRRLVSLIGPAAAKYLLLSADLVDAPHALRIGLVDEIHPARLLAARVADFCGMVASRSQLTVRASKEIVDAIAEDRLTDRHTAWSKLSFESGEIDEGAIPSCFSN